MFNFFASVTLVIFSIIPNVAMAFEVYGPYPITLKDYQGQETNSVNYSEQISQHLLHSSLKKAISSGASLEVMNRYFNGAEEELLILDPISSDGFIFDGKDINKIAKTNLSGMVYKDIIPGWLGGMTAKEVLSSMIEKAAQSKNGYDPIHGYDYAQLVSKFTMGAVFYHQACGNHLNKMLDADYKPNNAPYKSGAHYTGKEHSWDQAYGYWGAAAHGATLSAVQNYNIAKQKNEVFADFNLDGVVNLMSEMNYAYAYYASSFDKSGLTDYYNLITKAYIEGRQIITEANGNLLSEDTRSELEEKAWIICSNWELVISEAIFRYAGIIYTDLENLTANRGDKKAYREYVKHWGELKGFALSLHTGGRSLGELGTRIDNIIGLGPVVGRVFPAEIAENSVQVTGVNSDGSFVLSDASADGYMKNMLKLQKLLQEEFEIMAKNNNKL